jgi:uncharacterized integral membrane protein
MKHEEANGELSADSGGSGPPWKLLALLLVVVALAIFFFQNDADVQIDFLWLDFTWPLWAVIGISVVIGIVLDRLGTWQWRRARSRRAAE